jgi:hypothetical protein
MDKFPRFGPLELASVLGLKEEFREAYRTGILQVWYFSLDIHFILPHVKF